MKKLFIVSLSLFIIPVAYSQRVKTFSDPRPVREKTSYEKEPRISPKKSKIPVTDSTVAIGGENSGTIPKPKPKPLPSTNAKDSIDIGGEGSGTIPVPKPKPKPNHK